MIPFYRPNFDHLELIAALRPGPAREKFEAAAAARAGAEYGLAFPYGRVGLIAALKALDVPAGEIVLPAYTCLVIAHAVVASGHRPVFTDIDLVDFNMDVRALPKALSARTRAVLATHMYGYPTDIEAIRAVLDDDKILVIEDAALGTPSFITPGRRLRGDLGLLSFGFGKPMSTVEGGVIVTNSSDAYEKIRAYRESHINQDSYKILAKRWLKLLTGYLVFAPTIYKFWHRYQVERRPEFSGGPRPEFQLPPDYLPADSAVAYTNFQARIGLTQLNKLDSMVAKRRALAQLYAQGLHNLPGIHPPPLVDDATYAYYTIRVPKRDEINFRVRMAQYGIAVDQTFDYALPQLKVFQSFAQGAYPRAEQAANEVVNLPCYPDLTPVQAQHIITGVRHLLQN